jgi:FkbM family methyltransferase
MMRDDLRHHGVAWSALMQRLYRGPDFPARLRILRWLERVAGARRLVVSGRCGERYAVDHADYVQSTLLFDGAYEPEVADALRARLREGDVVLDLGANVGACSLPLACAMPVSVVAIEADPAVAALLRLNARLSGIAPARFEVVVAAIADAPGRAVLRRAPQANIGRSTLEALDDAVAEIEVEVETIDRLRERGVFGRARAWKIDVEGAEARVLRGAQATLRECPPDLVVFEDAAVSVEESPIAAILKGHGFDCARIPRPSGEVHPRENFLALRRGAPA